MSELKVKERDVVVPGEVLATGMDYLPSAGTYRLGEEIRCSRLGLVRLDGKVIKIIPLTGRYMPKIGDTIVGQVIDVLMSGWRLEVNTAYQAVLSMRDATSQFIERGSDLTKFYELGEYVVCKVSNVTSQKLLDVTMRGPGLRKLSGGRIVDVNPQKVPRIIGKEGSMIILIKENTGCKLVVGQNGLIWLEGEPAKENIAIEAIRKIEAEGHLPGLTERIKKFLKSKGE